ncbi:MAG: phage tail protein [Bacteroidales bacterium]
MDYLRLGDLKLTANDGVKGFEEQTQYNYAKISLTYGKPVLQAIGENLANITLQISLRSFLQHDINAMLEQLDKMQTAGEAYLLVFASGMFKGQYVIEQRRTSILRTDAAGTIKEADIELQLLEYADREVVASKNVEKGNSVIIRKTSI